MTSFIHNLVLHCYFAAVKLQAKFYMPLYGERALSSAAICPSVCLSHAPRLTKFILGLFIIEH